MTVGLMHAGWKVMPLSQVGRWGSGGTPKRGVAKYFGGDIPWVKSGDLGDGVVTRVEEYITEDGLSSSSAKLVDPGTLLIAMYGATIGKLGVPAMRCATNQAIAFCVPDPSIATTDYLFELLLHMRPELIALGKGGAQPNISQTVLKALEIPVPPLDVQAALVHVLRQIRASSASIADHLEMAARVIERFRRGVLAAACSGRLTADWRLARGLVDADTPASWQMTTFDEVCERVTVGHVGKMVSEYRDEGVPFLRSLNVRELRFDPADLKYISPEFHQRLRKSSLRPGDVVVVRSGFVGTACVIPDSVPEANCSDLLIARPGPGLLPAFAAIYINSPQMRAHVGGVSVGSAQLHFNTRSLQSAPLTLPPLDEQVELTRRVDQLLQLGSGLRTRIDTASKRVERSSQAVLAKAFRGDLIGAASAAV